MKIDNIFKRTVTEKLFSEQYDVPYGAYNNIVDGLRSHDSHVKMLAKILKTVDDSVEEKKREQRIFNQEGAVEFTDSEKQSMYKQIMKLMQTEF